MKETKKVPTWVRSHFAALASCIFFLFTPGCADEGACYECSASGDFICAETTSSSCGTEPLGIGERWGYVGGSSCEDIEHFRFEMCDKGTQSTNGGSSGSSDGSGSDDCDYSACVQRCMEAGGTGCGDLCRCD